MGIYNVGRRDSATKELVTYFASSESIFGLRSKTEGLIQMALSGGHSGGANAAEDAMIRLVDDAGNKVGVQRAVMAALHVIGELHRTVLWAAHGHFTAPPEVKRELGGVERVALMTAAASAGYAAGKRDGETFEAWLVRQCRKPDQVKAIGDQATTMLNAAHAAYATARKPEEGSRGVGAFRQQTRATRAPVERKSVGDAFDPKGWRP